MGCKLIVILDVCVPLNRRRSRSKVPQLNLLLRAMLHEWYMKRCLDLAAKGLGTVAPNPMVGAVLMHHHRIIGEGFHTAFGKAHAEVEAIRSVKKEDESLLSESTLYVNLEPCSHYGKTPPCANLILEKKIPNVVLAQSDPNPVVAGKGIRLLKEHGVNVVEGVLENEARFLNRRFNIFHEKKRPYVILKWAQTADGFIGSGNQERLMISDETSQVLVHRWRTQEQAVLIGYQTALLDNPLLTARLAKGNQAMRVVIDKQATLPKELRVFNDDAHTLIVTTTKPPFADSRYVQLPEENFYESLLQHLYGMQISSVIVEGGKKTLQAFIHSGLWDEARVIHSNKRYGKTSGVKAPCFTYSAQEIVPLNNDTLHLHYHS